MAGEEGGSVGDLRPFPPGRGPECPECGADLRKAAGASMRTLAAISSGYDDDGVYHRHDPNWNKSTYRCENGHRVRRSVQSKCPAQGCDYGGDVEMAVIDEE